MSDARGPGRRPGLGRGLSALLEETDLRVAAASGEEGAPVGPDLRSQVIALARVKPNPSQPRRRFDEDSQGELIESVRRQGLLQPVLVRPLPGGSFEIVAGERRWRAAQAAQLHEIPVVIRELDDGEAYELSLIENIQRQDLSPIEEARGYRHLTQQYGHTQAAVAELVGKSRSHIANLMRLLDLPEPVREMVDDGRLAMGHARALLGSDDPERLAREIVEKGLTARDAERMGRGDAEAGGKSGRRGSRASGEVDPDIAALEARIAESTGLRARLKHGGESGELTLRYSNPLQLDDLISRLTS